MRSYERMALFLWALAAPLCLFAQNDVDHIAKGDQYARDFDLQKALDEFKKAHELDSSNCTALWKIANAYLNLGEQAAKSTRLQYFYHSEKWARKALTQCPDTPDAHFLVAISSGKIAQYSGAREKIRRSREVKEELQRTLELDPNHHGAYHAFGIWNRELASLNWIEKAAAGIVYGGVPTGASMEKAVAYFKKAIEIKPNWIVHHKELGITYMKMKKWQLARKEFKTALDLPELDHQDKEHKQECRKFLKKMAGKE